MANTYSYIIPIVILKLLYAASKHPRPKVLASLQYRTVMQGQEYCIEAVNEPTAPIRRAGSAGKVVFGVFENVFASAY